MRSSLFDSRYFITVICVALTLFLLSGCALQTGGDNGELEAENARLQEEIGGLEAEIDRLKQEGFSEEQCEAMLRKLFTEDELRSLAIEKGIIYRLEVNQKWVREPLIVVAAGEGPTGLDIKVSQRADPITVIPKSIIQLAYIDDLNVHMEIVESSTDYTFERTDEGTAGWFFENPGKGLTVKVKISEELRARLGLDFQEFTVRVE